jgi:hypothetical protein
VILAETSLLGLQPDLHSSFDSALRMIAALVGDAKKVRSYSMHQMQNSIHQLHVVDIMSA